ncbi:MAG: glycosyl transferase family 2 [Phycisphaerales bacterium]|nr:glycosyl transferase family 2 [Phycisphaerales bacterium]
MHADDKVLRGKSPRVSDRTDDVELGLGPDLTLSALAPPKVIHAGAPSVDGKFLRVGGRRFWVRGVTYGTFAANEQGEPYPEFSRLKEDFAQMAAAGVNTVRLYVPPTDRIADAASDAGLYLIPDICWGSRTCELHNPQDTATIYRWTRGHARRLAGHPSILMFSIGNEIPPLIVRWYGRDRIERFLLELNDIVKAEAPDALVTYACHPPTEHLHLPFLDVVSFNVYMERERDFRKYLARLQNLAGERPLLLSEIGMDSSANGEAAQARLLDWQLRATFDKGLCGATVYSWTDEWAIFKESVDGWSFGITDNSRKPKVALDAVSRIYKSGLYDLRRTPWPRVSVVVCSYNGGRTLAQCLRSLSHLKYPDFEVIVIDDGSADDTSAIAREFPVRCVRTDNGGLSRARNLGIEQSTGEVIAYIDADAYADADWLFHMVTALEEHDAAAVGGPNLSPRGDGFVAQCVDHAPGNPTHVLIDDELALHVPGCNMAYRKSSLDAIGRFDAVHRTAGDDVDVCWKLLAREMKIAFAPGAIVWHHRRPTVRGFLRQQKGYGYAEAHLRQRYPGRFNVFGHAVWTGGIYDGVHHGLRSDGLPKLMRPKVFQGRFGAAQFQSLYQPFQTWWFQIFTSFEWQVLTASVLGASATSMAFGHALWSAGLLAVSIALMAATLGTACYAGWHAGRAKHWRGRRAIAGGLLVAFLHVAQPLARAAGRLKGWWHTRKQTQDWPAVQKLWGNMGQRDHWLERFLEHAKTCGWSCEPAGEWDDDDIIINGPGPCRVTLTSVAEERLDINNYFVRYRVLARTKPSAYALNAALIAALAFLGFKPALLPLAVPLVMALKVMLQSKRVMTNAVSQLALEIAEANRMPKVLEDWC